MEPSIFENLKKGPKAWNEWRNENPKDLLDLSGYDFTQHEKLFSDINGFDIWDFSKTDLTESNLSGLNLKYCSFIDSYLHGTDFSNSDLQGASLETYDIIKTKLVGANIKDATFYEDCDFSILSEPHLIDFSEIQLFPSHREYEAELKSRSFRNNHVLKWPRVIWNRLCNYLDPLVEKVHWGNLRSIGEFDLLSNVSYLSMLFVPIIAAL